MQDESTSVPTVPPAAKKLPLANGIPVPFVAKKAPFPLHHLDTYLVMMASQRRLCALCGEKLDYWQIFLGKDGNAKARLYSDPPMHRACAEYAVQVYPFWTAKSLGPNDPMPHVHKRALYGESPHALLYVTRSYVFDIKIVGFRFGAFRAGPVRELLQFKDRAFTKVLQ